MILPLLAVLHVPQRAGAWNQRLEAMPEAILRALIYGDARVAEDRLHKIRSMREVPAEYVRLRRRRRQAVAGLADDKRGTVPILRPGPLCVRQEKTIVVQHNHHCRVVERHPSGRVGAVLHADACALQVIEYCTKSDIEPRNACEMLPLFRTKTRLVRVVTGVW